MRRLLLVLSLALTVMVLQVAPAAACINDRETVRTEQEFKKNYEFKSNFQQQEPVYQPSAPTGTEWGPLTATWGGAGLLLLAVGMVAVNLRFRNRGA